MSTTSLVTGNQSSASAVNEIFKEIRDQGTSILDVLTSIQLDTLVNFDRRLTELSSKKQRASRVKAPGVAALFVVSDFNDIDQGQTTATVRIDTASATLRERRTPTTALVTSTAFSASSGTVNPLNADQTLFTVFSKNIPTGTFTLELQQSVAIAVLTIDLVAMASSPKVTLQISADGLVYSSVDKVSLNGDVLTAWFAEQEVKYIQVILTPSQPDNMGGDSYTFGITAFSATTVSYSLISDVVFRPIEINVQGKTLRFRAQGSGDLIYNLLLDNGTDPASYVPVTNGSYVTVPGTGDFSQTATINASGTLSATVPAGTYLKTLAVKNTTTGFQYPVIADLSPSDLRISTLASPVAALNGQTVTILPVPVSLSDSFQLTGLAGPASVKATLLVHLSTDDKNQTPVFKGASLEDQ